MTNPLEKTRRGAVFAPWYGTIRASGHCLILTGCGLIVACNAEPGGKTSSPLADPTAAARPTTTQANTGQSEILEPLADFRAEPRVAVVGQSVQFTDQSYSGVAEITARNWDFGDGAASSDTRPSHVYAAPGVYTVSLRAASSAGDNLCVKKDYVRVETEPVPAIASKPDGALVIEPTGRGSFLRINHPENPDAACTLWAPELINFPSLMEGTNALCEGSLPFVRDAQTGTLHYTLECKDAVLTATFEPYSDHVVCTYTATAREGSDPPQQYQVNPCQQLGDSIFDGLDSDLRNRIFFLSGGRWTRLGDCPDAGVRSMINSQEQSTAAAQDIGLIRIVRSRRADTPILACVSRDGGWVCATASEGSGYLFNNALPAYRCIHSPASVPSEGKRTLTLRVHVYLLRGDLDMLRAAYERDLKPRTP